LTSAGVLEKTVAKKGTTSNGNGRLEEAMALLIQNQAAFNANQTAFLARLAEIDRVTSERFQRIEKDIAAILRVLAEHGRVLAEHGRVLAEHGRLLERLPEAIRDKIGFKAAN
jgi:hypothetical protein